ncbi:hypothetical protein JCM8208_000463 [Rhodotorula glutinis]
MRPVDLPPDDDPPPVLLLPALPRHYHAAQWLAQDWVQHGETQLRGFQLFAVEQRHSLMPVIVVLTGDKADCITVERFELQRAATFNSDERAAVWNKTKAVLKHAGTRVNQTPQGHVPLTALPSLPPSLSLVQLPPVPLPFRPSSSTDSDPPLDAADYRHHEPLLIQNINLRRLGLGGRAGFRLPPSASSASSSKHAPVASGATPAQQLHFLQAYQLPVPPPSTSPPSSAPTSLALSLAARPPAPRDFTRTVLALGRTVQHALALFGLGPVKAYLASSVVRVVQARRRDGPRVGPGGEQAPHGDGDDRDGMLDRDAIERALLEALLNESAAAGAGSSTSASGSSARVVPLPSPGVELVLEDWAEALGLAVPPTSTSSAPDAPALAAAGVGAGPMLLEGDGLLCDTTVAALSVFRLAYAERFVASADPRAAGGGGGPSGVGEAAGASRLLDDDGSLLPPALLAALLSLVVATRGKMVVLGGITGTGAGEGGSAAAAGAAGGTGSRSGPLRRRHGTEERRERDEEKVPKDPLAKRERFLRCVEAFQRSHPSAFQHVAASSTCPPVLTPSFLAALSTLYASRHSPATSLHSHGHAHSHLPHLPTSRVRGALSSALGSVLHPDRDRDSPSTAPSDADTPSHSEHERAPHRHPQQQQQGRRRSALPHPLTALHLPFGSRTRGGRGEHAETLDLEGFVRAYVLGDDEGEANDGGGRGARARVRRRRRRARGAGRAGASVRGLWDPEEDDDRARDEEHGGGVERSGEKRRDEEAVEAATDADSVYTARTGGTAQQQQQPAPSSAPASSSAPPTHGSTPASSSSTSTGPVKFGRGVLRGVKEVAGRAGRKLGDELGLGVAEAAGESSDGRKTPRDEMDEKEREGLGPPLVVVSRTQSPRGSTTSGATHRALPSLQTDVAPSSASARASPVSAGGTSSPGGAAQGRSQLSLGLSVPGERRSPRGGAPPMRRAVSETHPRKGSLLLGREGEGEGEREERVEGRVELEESLLFGAEEGGSATDDEGPEGLAPSARARDDDSATDDDGDGDEAVCRRPSGLVRAPRLLTRRHSFNLVDDAPEPVVWLSRRTLEVDVNLRATAWAFKVKQKKLEDMVAAMEAIQRAYDQALSSLAGPLAHKTAQLDALSATAAQLTKRLEAYSASSSPLSLLSTGTSRLQYAQAVLDDKLRDVVDFDRALDDKVRAGDGTLEVAVRELERDMGVMRKVLGVLESGSAWVWSKSLAMSARLASLVPPKIASASAIGAPATAARNANIVSFYSALPKGAAAKKPVGLSPFSRYKARYFDGENASGAPFLHAIGVLFLVGYTIDYNMHLKHHKK